MNTVLFFDRCDLTDMYIPIGIALKGKANVVHVAFSKEEKNKLDAMNVDGYIDYQKKLNSYIDSYPVDSAVINEIDNLIIKASNGCFNLNSSIQSDRGFSILSYDEALLLAQSHYLVWKEIFSIHKVDLMYHEICSQFMVHIAALLCKNQGGVYRDLIQCSYDKKGYYYLNVDGENFSCPEIERRYNYLVNNPKAIDKERCQAYLQNFRKDYSVFFGSEINLKMPYTKIAFQALRSWAVKRVKKNQYDRIKNNISYWLLQQNSSAAKLHNIRDYKRRNVVFENRIPEGETYYYYSFHLEPEATVLYLGEGIYENQVKLIQNIAASLPAGSYLYVKDHPHEYAYRDACDYERLMRIPNVRLINQSIPGKKMIANSKGVFSINGTACFEALLLGKQVFCMSASYYSCQERVNVIRNIRDVRDVVYSLKDTEYKDDDNLLAFVDAFLQSAHVGYTNFFCNRHVVLGIDVPNNGYVMAADILKEFNAQ